MGNPANPGIFEGTSRGVTTWPDPLPINPRNGILIYVSSEFTGAAYQMLPKAHANEQPVRKVEIDVPDIGLVRLTFELREFRHHKSYHWSWLVKHAEKVHPKESP